MSDDPNIQHDDNPQWDFPNVDPLPPDKQFVTRADLEAVTQNIVNQLRRPTVDPSVDPDTAAILEALEKDPAKGFKMHTDHIVKGVTTQVAAEMLKMDTANRMRAEEPVMRQNIASRIIKNTDGTSLSDAAKDYVLDYLQAYNVEGMGNILKHEPSLKALRLAAERVHMTGGLGTPQKPVGSGGTGGTGGPPASGGLSAEDEAEAQLLFDANKGVKGYTIEMARATMKSPMNDRSVVTQKNSDWQDK